MAAGADVLDRGAEQAATLLAVSHLGQSVELVGEGAHTVEHVGVVYRAVCVDGLEGKAGVTRAQQPQYLDGVEKLLGADEPQACIGQHVGTRVHGGGGIAPRHRPQVLREVLDGGGVQRLAVVVGQVEGGEVLEIQGRAEAGHGVGDDILPVGGRGEYVGAVYHLEIALAQLLGAQLLRCDLCGGSGGIVGRGHRTRMISSSVMT